MRRLTKVASGTTINAIMLFALRLGGSLLAGFGMAAATARSWVHMVIFVATLSSTLYVIRTLNFRGADPYRKF